MAWGTMLVGLLGGLALFLFGLEQLAEALKARATRLLHAASDLEAVARLEQKGGGDG